MKVPCFTKAIPGANNINGRTVIKAESWMALKASYIMYFAGHADKEIKIAVSNNPRGPWKMASAVVSKGFDVGWSHIASPDLYIDYPSEKELGCIFMLVQKKVNGHMLQQAKMGSHFQCTPWKRLPHFIYVYSNLMGLFLAGQVGNNATVIMRSRNDGLGKFSPGANGTCQTAVIHRCFYF